MRLLFATLCFALWSGVVYAQDLHIGTVTRVPFSMTDSSGAPTGFSMDLFTAVATEMGRTFSIERYDSFAAMLGAVQAGDIDAAIANISITAGREEVMDFSQPIFSAGLQIMIPTQESSLMGMREALFSTDILIAIAGAFALLFGGGMMMWVFERKSQPYFDRPASDALFPSFWWALNLVVNGGFEERMPRTFMGRVFGVTLVVSSLFIVSVFVAKITAAMTVSAITTSVGGVNDLYDKRVATVSLSTASQFLDRREIPYRAFANPDEMLLAFEATEVDAVVFDAPILAYYATHKGAGRAQMVGGVFLREDYGIALPSDSDLAEPINHALLTLRENGTYSQIQRMWFGSLSD